MTLPLSFEAALPNLIAISRQAGAKIMEIHERGVQARVKGDGSPVTEADQQAEDLILAVLKQLSPDIPIISEENAASHSLAALASTGFIRVEAGTSCEEFARQLAANEDTQPRPVLVVDAQGRYQGMLSLQAAVSRKNRSRSVGEVSTTVEALSGMTSAESALKSPTVRVDTPATPGPSGAESSSWC